MSANSAYIGLWDYFPDKELIELLRTYAGTDWQLAALACQVLCNFICYDGHNFSVYELLGQETEAELESLLIDLIDPNVIDEMQSQYRPGESQDLLSKSVWTSEFLPVATHLLSLLRES